MTSEKSYLRTKHRIRRWVLDIDRWNRYEKQRQDIIIKDPLSFFAKVFPFSSKFSLCIRDWRNVKIIVSHYWTTPLPNQSFRWQFKHLSGSGKVLSLFANTIACSLSHEKFENRVWKYWAISSFCQNNCVPLKQKMWERVERRLKSYHLRFATIIHLSTLYA